jgi:hypothetical protein
MLELPVRIEIKEKIDSAFIRFTIPSLSFIGPPSAKDIIEFRYTGWAERELGEVQYIYHACGDAEGRGAVAFTVIIVPDHGQLLLTFDKFKDSTKIMDLETSNTSPPAYYKLYRLLLKLWGKTNYSHIQDSPQAIGGLVRAALIAAGHDDTAAIEALHVILIEDRKRNRGDDIQLLRLLLAWDKQTGRAVAGANANEDATLAAAAILFSKIKSLNNEQLPLCLRQP